MAADKPFEQGNFAYVGQGMYYMENNEARTSNDNQKQDEHHFI